MIVVDASVVVDLLLGAGSPAGDALAARFTAGALVSAPHIIDAEVGQAVRRFDLRGDLADGAAPAMVGDLVDLPIHRYPHRALLTRAFEFRANVTFYDGLYLALAEALAAPLLTGDGALRDVPGCEATVEILATTA